MWSTYTQIWGGQCSISSLTACLPLSYLSSLTTVSVFSAVIGKSVNRDIIIRTVLLSDSNHKSACQAVPTWISGAAKQWHQGAAHLSYFYSPSSEMFMFAERFHQFPAWYMRGPCLETKKRDFSSLQLFYQERKPSPKLSIWLSLKLPLNMIRS